ncbi:hypothetical protein ACQPZG_27730 [Streptomyces sp. CA-294286]|uniref:hypothetical protein n=1 Tax=Streptomyces sp. CA-294286 TaxID=3240070 RepID=UPI003D8AE8A7
MHTPAPTAPAHARPRAVHWLITAAATAAVIAGAALLQPATATATQETPTAAEARPAPDPKAATYPLECRGGAPRVVNRATGDLDGDGHPETVAVVRCDAGIGTPPSGIYVLTSPHRVVATLLDPRDGENVTEIAIAGGAVAATLLGYSSDAVARCCPDRTQKVKWQWRNGKFTRSATPDARGV